MIAFQSLRQRKPIDWAFGLLSTLPPRLNLTLLSVAVLFQLSGPLMAMPERSVITLQDTTQLSLRVWAVTAPQRIVIGIHGFNDYSKAFDPLARSLATELMATFYAYDQRGFGENSAPGVWPGSDQLVADLREVVSRLRKEYPGLPITLIGESMGGAVAIRASTESPGLPVSQLILKAPALWGAETMPWFQRAGLQMLNAVAPNLTFSGRGVRALGIKPTNDPEVSKDLSRDPFFIKETRVSSLMGVTDLMGQALHHPMSFPVPTLVLYGLNDRIIPPAPICSWLTRLDRETSSLPVHIQFLIYPEGWHLLTRQLGAAEVIQDIGQWIRSMPPEPTLNAPVRGASAFTTLLTLQAARQAVCQR